MCFICWGERWDLQPQCPWDQIPPQRDNCSHFHFLNAMTALLSILHSKTSFPHEDSKRVGQTYLLRQSTILFLNSELYKACIVEALYDVPKQPYLLFAVRWDGQSTIRLEQFQETGKKRKVACPQIGRQYWRLD